MNYRLSASYEAYQSIKLVKKIRFRSSESPEGDGWRYVHPLDQLVCSHHPKVNSVYRFSKYRVNHRITLNKSEFNQFYRIDAVTGRLELATGRPLMTDEEFHRQQFNDQYCRELYEHHAQHCARCKEWKVKKKTIRKREKLTSTELQNIAFDLGQSCHPSTIANSY